MIMETIIFIAKVTALAVALPFFVIGVMVGARWYKEPHRRIKLSFLGTAVELGEDKDGTS